MEAKTAITEITKYVRKLRQKEDGANRIIKALNLAIDALGKQDPKEVILYSDGYADGYPVYDQGGCPKCNFPFNDDEGDWESNYCPNCGQRLDWGASDAEKHFPEPPEVKG